MLDLAGECNDNYNPIHGVIATALLTLAVAVEMVSPAVGADLAGSVFLAMMFAEQKVTDDNRMG